MASSTARSRDVSSPRGNVLPLASPGVANGNTLPLGELTSRERAVLEAIAEGLDNAEIAASLRLSEKTVRNYVTRLFDKIHVKHRYEAIVRARDAGLGGGHKAPQPAATRDI